MSSVEMSEAEVSGRVLSVALIQGILFNSKMSEIKQTQILYKYKNKNEKQQFNRLNNQIFITIYGLIRWVWSINLIFLCYFNALIFI